MQLFAQIIGLVALVFALVVFQNDHRKKMLYLQLCAATLFSVHFGLLGAFTGMAMNMLSATRNYLFVMTEGWDRKWRTPIIFMVLFSLATIVTWEGPKSLLPLGGMITGTLAFWQIRPGRIRLLALISPPLWFLYNFMSGSYAGMAVEVIMFSSIITGIYRFDTKKGIK